MTEFFTTSHITFQADKNTSLKKKNNLRVVGQKLMSKLGATALGLIMLTGFFAPQAAYTQNSDVYEQQKAEHYQILNQFGLATSEDDKPSDYRTDDGNPFGSKFVNMSAVSELYLYSGESSGNNKRYFFDNGKYEPDAALHIEPTSQTVDAEIVPIKAVPLNVSKNTGANQEYTAELVAVDKNNFKVQIRGKNGSIVSGSYTETFNVGDWSVMQNRSYEQLFEHYFQIVSGDFNGDGCDDIAYYMPQIKNWGNSATRTWKIRIVFLQKSNNSVTKFGEIVDLDRTDKNFGSGAVSNWLSTPCVQLSTTNLNKDSSDDLVVIRSWTKPSNGTGAGNDGASSIYIFDNLKARNPTNTTPSFLSKLEEADGNAFADLQINPKGYDYSPTWEDGGILDVDVTKPHTSALMAASVATGSITAANSSELVIAGYVIVKQPTKYTDRYIPLTYRDEKIKAYHNTYVGLAVLKYNPADGYEFIDKNGGTSDNFTYQLINEKFPTVQSSFISYNLPAPIALTTAKLIGTQYQSYVFADGVPYLMDLSGGKYNFRADSLSTQSLEISKHKSYESLSGVAISSTSPFSSNQWMKQSVAANVTGDPFGRQHVYSLLTWGNRTAVDEFRADHMENLPEKAKLGFIGVPFGSVRYYLGMFPFYFTDNLAAGRWASLCVQDVDAGDGLVAEFIERRFTYTQPKILAVFAAAPYFADLAASNVVYSYAGETKISESQTEGDEHEINAGATLGNFFWAGAEAGPVAVELKIGVDISADYTTKHGWSRVESFTHTNNKPYDQVLISSVPIDIAYYRITRADGKKDTMTVTTPYSSREVMIPVSEYDEIAKKTPNYPLISGKILKHTVGIPATYENFKYPTSKDGLIDSVRRDNPSDAWKSSGTTASMEIQLEKTYSNGVALEIAVWFELGAKIFAGGGAQAKSRVGYGFTHFGSKGKGFFGSIPEIAADGYKFEWRIRHFEVRTEEKNGISMEFPVLTYETKNTTRSIAAPTNLNVKDADTKSITLGWTKSNDASAYELQYRMKGNNWVTLDNDISSDSTSIKHEGLSEGKIYEYRLRARDGIGKYSVYTAVCEAYTTVSSMPSFSKDITDLEVSAGDEAIFSVKVTSGREGQVDYLWQELYGSVWDDILNSNKNNYKISDASIFDAGRTFRCIVTETKEGVPARIVSAEGKLKIKKEVAEVVLTLSKNEGDITYKAKPGTKITLTAVVSSPVVGDKTGNVTFSIELPKADSGEDGKYIPLIGVKTENDTYTAVFTAVTAGDHVITASYSGNVDYAPAVAASQTYTAKYPAGEKMLVLEDNAGNEYFDGEFPQTYVVYGDSVLYTVYLAEVEAGGSLSKTRLTTDDLEIGQLITNNFDVEDDGDKIKFIGARINNLNIPMEHIQLRYKDDDAIRFDLQKLRTKQRPAIINIDDHIIAVGESCPELTFTLEEERDGRGFLEKDRANINTLFTNSLTCDFDKNQRGTYLIREKSINVDVELLYQIQRNTAFVKVIEGGVIVNFEVVGSSDALIISSASESGEYGSPFKSGSLVENIMTLEFELILNNPDKHLKEWLVNGTPVPSNNQNILTLDLSEYAEDETMLVKAVLADTYYNVTYAASSETDGSIQGYYSGTEAFPSGIDMLSGMELTFVATPAIGYNVKEWIIDNVPVAENTSNELVISRLNKATTVLVVFEKTPITGIDDHVAQQAKPLKAWMQNEQLHVSGLVVGEPWSAYSISGVLLYQSIANSDKAEITLPVRGMYIVKSGYVAVKTVY